MPTKNEKEDLAMDKGQAGEIEGGKGWNFQCADGLWIRVNRDTHVPINYDQACSK